MMDDKQIGTGIVASILTGTIATILGGIVLQWFTPSSSGNQSDTPTAIQNIATPPKAAPAPRHQARLANTSREVPLPDSAQDEDHKTELRNRASPSRAWERERQTLREQLSAQQEKMDELKRMIDELKRNVASHQHAETNRSIQAPTPLVKQRTQRADGSDSVVCSLSLKPEEKRSSRKENATPQQTTVLLYYRVVSQTTKQIEYARIDEVTRFLRSIDLSYVRGRPYKDSGLSPLWIPIAINKTTSWQTYDAKSVAHRDRIKSKMLALGIETRIDKPEEIDDCSTTPRFTGDRR
jgi:hypothetical protein